jgi:hypothetical protein
MAKAQKFGELDDDGVREVMKSLAAMLDSLLGPVGANFVLLVFDDAERAHYIASIEREGGIEAMRETADRLESGQLKLR